MSAQKLIVLFFALAASVNALATPHAIRHAARHHQIAARVADPAPLEVPVPVSSPLRRRQNSRRCKPKPPPAAAPVAETTTTTTSTTTSSTTSSTPTSTPTPPPQTPNPPPKEPPTAGPQANTGNGGNPANGGNTGGGGPPGFLTGIQTGQATFYATGLGSCGVTNNDNDMMVAVSHLLYDTYPGYVLGNPNNNPICGKEIEVTLNGVTIVVKVEDRCEACALTDLDFSPKAFGMMADFAKGRVDGMKWKWV